MLDVATQRAAYAESVNVFIACPASRARASGAVFRADAPRHVMVLPDLVLAEHPILACFPTEPLGGIRRIWHAASYGVVARRGGKVCGEDADCITTGKRRAMSDDAQYVASSLGSVAEESADDAMVSGYGG